MTNEITQKYEHAADAASNALHRAGEQAASMAQRGSDAMHHGADALQRRSDKLQSKALHLTHDATAYIHREPAKSMLVAAATGAVLMALVTMLARMRNGG
jgi:ElaB/YqjD/DUF883 family membrane-anchored ribosome-binding protein